MIIIKIGMWNKVEEIEESMCIQALADKMSFREEKSNISFFKTTRLRKGDFKPTLSSFRVLNNFLSLLSL